MTGNLSLDQWSTITLGRHARLLSLSTKYRCVTFWIDAYISTNFFHFSHLNLITGSAVPYFTRQKAQTKLACETHIGS